MTPPIYRHRPLFDTIEAFEYAGQFPLSFLMPSETVRRAAAGSSACVVRQKDGTEVTVHRHQYVVRDLATGLIRVESAEGWFRRYERTEHVNAPAHNGRSATVEMICLEDDEEGEHVCYLPLGHDGEHVWTPFGNGRSNLPGEQQ